MKIKTVTDNNLRLNNLTKYGRMRNQIIQKMKDNGCQIIKEYRENCNSRVYLGYVNEFVRLANFSARVQRNGAYEEKYCMGIYSPIPSSAKTFYVEKVKNDDQNNEIISTRKIKIKNGVVVEETVRQMSRFDIENLSKKENSANLATIELYKL